MIQGVGVAGCLRDFMEAIDEYRQTETQLSNAGVYDRGYHLHKEQKAVNRAEAAFIDALRKELDAEVVDG